MGGSIASVLIAAGVLLCGFAGWIAFASGLGSWDTNPNLYMFEVFKASYWVSVKEQAYTGTSCVLLLEGEGSIGGLGDLRKCPVFVADYLNHPLC
jgi:hypothetical protein